MKAFPLRGSRFVTERLETPLRRLPFGGDVGLDKDSGRYFPLSTASNPVLLVNSEVLELQAGYHAPVGKNFNTSRYRSSHQTDCIQAVCVS